MLELLYLRVDLPKFIVYIFCVVLVTMRYTLTAVSGPARRVFRNNAAYDDREIVRFARREGLTVTRPNGSTSIRGSSRLFVLKGVRIVARFERQAVVDAPAVKPVQVASIRGRLI